MATRHTIGNDCKLSIDTKRDKTWGEGVIGKGTIEFDIYEPQPSKGGKMDMLLSLSGFQSMGVNLDNKPISGNLQLGTKHS